VILVSTAIRVAGNRSTNDGVEMAGLYWHFVDLVWVFIFAFFYLW
jgi:cytochrome c oxidase subunit 3